MKCPSNHHLGLYDYQVEAINRLRNGSILCGNVGSGKSRTAIGYYFKEQGGSLEPFAPMKNPKDLYIITTAKKRDDHEWDGDMLPYLLSSKPENNIYNNNVIVDSWNNINKYIDIQGAFFLFDEQRVVGSGMWSKSFIKIAKKNSWILLTATPGDVWEDYIPVFIANGFYKNRTEFKSRHIIYSSYSKFPKVLRYVEQGRLIKLRKQILVNMDYIHQIRKHKEKILVEYDKTTYTSVQKTRWNVYEEAPIKNISEFCYTLRKIVNSDESRLEAVKKIVAKKNKVIVFYNYDYELEALKSIDILDSRGKKVKVAEWNGHHHERIPKADSWVYLVNYAAGAEGWNCIETDTIVFYSQSYSYKSMVQAAGRTDRLNTPFDDLYYYYLISTSPIDMAISVALKKKQNFNESSFAN